MNLYFYYNSNGTVSQYSESPCEVNSEILKEIELEVSENDLALIQLNYDLLIENGQLKITKPQRIIEEEQGKAVDQAKEELKQRLRDGTATTADISRLLLEIL